MARAKGAHTAAPTPTPTTAPQTPQKPPWAMSEDEKAQAAAKHEAQEAEKAEAEAAEEAVVAPLKEKIKKSKYAFGRLQAVQCPFHEDVYAMYHVGTRYGVFMAPVKDDDGKGMLRRVRNIAPYWVGLENIVNPLTDEPLTPPDPEDLDSYRVITGDLYHLWGEDFFAKWLIRDGWEQAIQEAGGITDPN